MLTLPCVPLHYLEEFMPARTLSVVIVMLGSLSVGCSNDSSSKPGEERGKPVKGTPPVDSAKNKSSGSEAEARSVLKSALDSWAFGDPIEKFEKAHPGVSFFDTNWITRKRLGRYEIGNVRKDGITYEFLVTLTFREDSDDVTKSGDYHVTRDADGWVITAGSR